MAKTMQSNNADVCMRGFLRQGIAFFSFYCNPQANYFDILDVAEVDREDGQ